MISELASTAMRLREVREARQQFLSLWAMERMTAMPELLDRIAEDVDGFATADNFSRMLLHRRSILDD